MMKWLSVSLRLFFLLVAASVMMVGCSAGKNAEGPAKEGSATEEPAKEGSATEEPAKEGSATEEPAKKAEYRKITPQEAKAMMDAGGVTILDVRTQEEFIGGHIQGAVLLPDTELAQKAETVLPDKNARILVYCRSGRRSELSAHALVDMGYTEIYDFGGIVDWPYDVVK